MLFSRGFLLPPFLTCNLDSKVFSCAFPLFIIVSALSTSPLFSLLECQAL